MLDSAIEKHEACATAISCSGLAPGPSSKRDLNEYSPLIVSPTVNVPFPERTSPFHSAVPFAGMPASSVATTFSSLVILRPAAVDLPRGRANAPLTCRLSQRPDRTRGHARGGG